MAPRDAGQQEYDEMVAPQMRRRRMAGAVGGKLIPFDPSIHGLDVIDNIYALHGVARLLTSWTGSLVRLRRSSDNAQQDFGAHPSTGFLPTSEINAWLAGATAFVVTLYGQSGNSRPATQSTAGNQPRLVLSGAFPIVSFDRTRPDKLLVQSATAVFQNSSAGSLIMVSSLRSPQSTTFDYMGCDIGGTGARFYLRQGAGGTDSMVARKTNAGSLDGPSGPPADLDTSHVRIARANWGTATARYDRDGSSATDGTFHSAGSTDNTASNEVAYSPGTQAANLDMSMGGWIVDALSDAEFTALRTGLAALRS